MHFTEEHLALKKTIKTFIEKEINPFVNAWEEAKIFPAHALFKKMGNLGLLGVHKPTEYGGLGLDYSYQLAFIEALGDIACGAIPMAIGVQTDMATPALVRFGSDELKKIFLTPAITGDAVACVGVSEPQAGSDVANIKTQAIKRNGDYVINGTKMWITNSTQADWICLLVNTEGGKPPYNNKSLMIVPLNTAGVKIEPRLEKLGAWSSDTAQIFFDNVKVPARFMIGEANKGFQYQMMQFQEERLFAAASMLCSMENIIQQTIEYTRNRHAFGKSILDNQIVYFSLAELQTEIEALRALVYRAAEQSLAGQDITTLASMAKFKVGRLSRVVADTCLQFWGGMGYMWETPVARFFRDSRLLSIGAGADEVMLGIIAKKMGMV